MKPFLSSLIWVLLNWPSLLYAGGPLVVVIHPGSSVETLSREEVINIFLGRYRQLPSGLLAQPVDQPAGQKASFYKLLVGKELPEINAYWSRLVFSGKTKPPQQARDLAEVIQWVNSLPGAIGYMEADQVDSRVKVALKLN
ncbi:MAG: hypothetical protein WCP34_10790 [Pseudomonadota bacterium]